jgi:hypothetical protein
MKLIIGARTFIGQPLTTLTPILNERCIPADPFNAGQVLATAFNPDISSNVMPFYAIKLLCPLAKGNFRCATELRRSRCF